MNTKREAAALLENAAIVIETHGLAKGIDRDINGCYCSVGALNRAVDIVDPEDGESLLIAERTLAREVSGVNSWTSSSAFDLITKWNDQPRREQVQVVSTMRAASKRLVAQ